LFLALEGAAGHGAADCTHRRTRRRCAVGAKQRRANVAHRDAAGAGPATPGSGLRPAARPGYRRQPDQRRAACRAGHQASGRTARYRCGLRPH